MKNRFLFPGVLAAFLLSAIGAFAQTSSGVITGVVMDVTGQTIPDADVSLTNDQTGDVRTAKTERTGEFIFTTVQPGRYTLNVTANGFKATQKKDLVLTASERLSAGTITMQIGSVSESVTVTAEATPVQTESQERSGLLNNKQLEELMTRGRDFMSLLRTMPGVVGGSNNESLGTETTPTINGVRSEYNQSTIDGVIGNTRGLATLDTPLNLDAISEVKVLQSNYQAEYGKGAGSIINAVTKSGTRDFHGTAYYYNRNEAFNANDFMNNRTIVDGKSVPRPRYRYHTIGGNIGGPIYIPGKLNQDKNKLFFFYSQEYLPNNTPSGLKTYTVPTDLERQGDFSKTVDLNNALIKITDPTTGKQFSGNIIPPDRINPSTQKLLSVFPLPNFFDRNVSGGKYNYVNSETRDTPVGQQILRVDYNISDKWRMFVRGMNMSVDNNGLNTPANKLQWAIPVDYKTHNPNVAANVATIFSPTLVNELTLGAAMWTEDQSIAAADLAKIQRDKLGISIGQFHPDNNPLNLIPAASFGGITGAAGIGYDGRFPMSNWVHSYSLTDGLTKIWNSHTFKFGVDLQRDQYLQQHHSGSAVFAGTFDFGRSTGNANPLDSGYAYANALLGNFNSYSEATARLDYLPTTRVIEWYAQDNWRVSRKLTLDYGFRFTYGVPQSLQVGANFVPSLYDPAKAPKLYMPALDAKGNRVAKNPITGELKPAVYIGAFVPGSGDPTNGTIQTGQAGVSNSLLNGQGVMVGPRIGFAYDPFGDGKTAIRGGFGIFYNARARSGQEGDMTFNPPAISNPQIFYGNVATFLNVGSSVQFPSSVNHAIEQNTKMPSTYNMSFGVQRNIGWGTVLDVAYVGTLGRHLSDFRNINLVPYGAHFLPQNADPTKAGAILPDDFFRPYMGYGNIPFQFFDSTSSYHSLQTQVTHRFRHGLQFGGVWTWSKAMDYTDDYNGTVATYAPLRMWNYGKAGYDRTHIVNINWLWDIPRASALWNQRVIKAVFDNWQISGIASFISGQPSGLSYSLVNSVDITGGGDGSRVVLTGNPILPRGQRSFDQWFNTSVVAVPAKGTFGNAPKDVIRLPGTNNIDLSLFKNIPIKERVVLQFRGEAYNALNHTQFSGVDTAARFDSTGKQVNARFGQVTDTRDPRTLQLAVRISF